MVGSVQCRVDWFTVHWALYILYSVHWALYTKHCTLGTVHCVLYTLHSVHWALNTEHCTLHTEQWSTVVHRVSPWQAASESYDPFLPQFVLVYSSSHSSLSQQAATHCAMCPSCSFLDRHACINGHLGKLDLYLSFFVICLFLCDFCNLDWCLLCSNNKNWVRKQAIKHVNEWATVPHD